VTPVLRHAVDANDHWEETDNELKSCDGDGAAWEGVQ
jgi:hypothetical protein